MDEAAPPIAEIKSRPNKLNTPAPIIKRIRYNIKKANTWITIGFSTTEWLCLSGIIAFGWSDLLNSNIHLYLSKYIKELINLNSKLYVLTL